MASSLRSLEQTCREFRKAWERGREGGRKEKGLGRDREEGKVW